MYYSTYFTSSPQDEESGLERLSDEAISAQRNLILYTDIYRIEQVLRNFITNAVSSKPEAMKCGRYYYYYYLNKFHVYY